MKKADFYYKGIPVWMQAPDCEYRQTGWVMWMNIPIRREREFYAVLDDGSYITTGPSTTPILCCLCEDFMGGEFYMPVPSVDVDLGEL